MLSDRSGTRERTPSGAGRALAGLSTAVLLAATVALHGCDDTALGLDGDSGDDRAPSSELTFLEPSPDAPRLLLEDSDGDGIPDTTFVATAGQDTTIEVYYEDPEDGGQGDRFLRFELDEESLLRYPDDHPDGRAGQEFTDGDTVHITLQVAGDTLLADFAPSGLEFDPEEPAELRMRWTNADRDTDDDGDDDLDDREDELDLWKQEQPGEDWIRSGDLKELEVDRIRAFLDSFTRFAMAI